MMGNQAGPEPGRGALGQPPPSGHPDPVLIGVDATSPAPGPANSDAVFVASFAEFYRVHHARIAGALALNFGDAELGREATDEAMTRAYRDWGTVSGHANPAGWVYRVGLNWGRSWYRRASRRLPWITPDSVELPETADPTLRNALADLDPKYRAVVVCRYYLDWSTERTADALDLPPGTVKSRLHHALAELRRQLEPHDRPADRPTPPPIPSNPSHQPGGRFR